MHRLFDPKGDVNSPYILAYFLGLNTGGLPSSEVIVVDTSYQELKTLLIYYHLKLVGEWKL